MFRKIGKIYVGQVGVELPHILVGEFDEVDTQAVTDSAGAAVEHKPDLPSFVEADFDEVIAGAKSTQMIGVVAAIELGMFGQDGIVRVSVPCTRAVGWARGCRARRRDHGPP